MPVRRPCGPGCPDADRCAWPSSPGSACALSRAARWNCPASSVARQASLQAPPHMNALGRLSDPEQFSDIVIRAGTGSEAVVHLRDVARIELGALQYTSSSRLNDRPTVFVAV